MNLIASFKHIIPHTHPQSDIQVHMCSEEIVQYLSRGQLDSHTVSLIPLTASFLSAFLRIISNFLLNNGVEIGE